METLVGSWDVLGGFLWLFLALSLFGVLFLMCGFENYFFGCSFENYLGFLLVTFMS